MRFVPLSLVLAAACGTSAFAPSSLVPSLRISPSLDLAGGGGRCCRERVSLVALAAKRGGKGKAKKGGAGKSSKQAKSVQEEKPAPEPVAEMSEEEEEILKASMMGNFDPSKGEDLGAEGMPMPGLPGLKIQTVDEEAVDRDVKKLIGDRTMEKTFVPIPKGAIVDDITKRRQEAMEQDIDAAFGLSGDVMRNLKTGTWACVAILFAVEIFVQSPLSENFRKANTSPEAIIKAGERTSSDSELMPGIRPWMPITNPEPPGKAAAIKAESDAAAAEAAKYPPAAPKPAAAPAPTAPTPAAPAASVPAPAPTPAPKPAAAPAPTAPTTAAPAASVPAPAPTPAPAPAAGAPAPAAPKPASTPSPSPPPGVRIPPPPTS